jgi:hypothetical protein
LRSHAEILRALRELGIDLDPGETANAPATVPITRSHRQPAAASRRREPVDVSGHTSAGDAVAIAVAGTEHLTLLAFLTSGCSSCLEFWAHLGRGVPDDLPNDVRVVVVTKGSEAESPARIRDLEPSSVPVVMSTAAWENYDVPVAPFFVFVHGPSSQILGEGAASTWPQIASLLHQALADAGVLDRRGRRKLGVHPTARADLEREARVDRDLLESGISPGDPRLYPKTYEDYHQQSAVDS